MDDEQKRKKREKHLKRQIWAFAFARNAFQGAKEIAEHYIKEAYHFGHPLHQALSTAVVILYSRPFMKSDNMIVLPVKFTRFDKPKLRETHDSLIAIRNTFYAHTDATAKASITISVKFDAATGDININSKVQDLALSPTMFPKLLPLCEVQLAKLDESYDEAFKMLYPQEKMLALLRAERKHETQFSIFWPKST
ncbi:MAG TPA: hypothetical protein VHY22_04075 [Chthoniobacteraceae bacterium]|jgi:hypothetical protein|nr:hypothetical protein [Chthoniobacteraceae bacterium]